MKNKEIGVSVSSPTDDNIDNPFNSINSASRHEQSKALKEYAVIRNMIKSLGVMCAANDDKIIDLLTGYLWDEEEAGAIKASDGSFNYNDLL